MHFAGMPMRTRCKLPAQVAPNRKGGSLALPPSQ
jgi:hypothetical protein